MARIIEIKVVPSSGKQSCVLYGERLKCFVKAAPEKGAANQELISFLAKKLQLPARDIRILTGATSRLKRVQIETEKSFDQICNDLGIDTQLSLV